jgi:signal transduction histidine kinase
MTVSQTDPIEQLARFGHDFNDLLTAIIGYTDLSLRRVGVDDPIRHNLEETRKAAERAACLVRQLRSIAKSVKPSLTLVNSSSESHQA